MSIFAINEGVWWRLVIAAGGHGQGMTLGQACSNQLDDLMASIQLRKGCLQWDYQDIIFG